MPDLNEPASPASIAATKLARRVSPPFLALCADQARRKPGCLVDLYLRDGFAAKVRAAPFDR